MSGNYDVGGGANHYATITAAAQALTANGVAGPVTFSVYPGTYTGEIYLGLIAGMGQQNPVVFQGTGAAMPVVTNPAGYGFNIMGSSYITIKKLEFTNFGNYGIYSTASGIDSANNITIEGCYFHSAGSGINQYAFNCHHIYLIGNECNGGNYGLRVRYCPNTYAYNNMIYNTTTSGLYTHMTANSEYYFNSIYGTGTYPLRYGSGNEGGMCMNNISYNPGATGACVFYQSQPAQHDYNCYYAPLGNVAIWLTIGNYLQTLQQLQATSNQEAHSISVDPAFLSFTDLHLSDTSACVAAGTPVALVSEDFDGDPRDPTTPCIGCDEVGGSGLVVTLTPVNPPIVIPAGGGSFQFNAQIENREQSASTFDAWTEAALPSGGVYGPIILRTGLSIAPGQTIARHGIGQFVPGYAPSGTYGYIGNVGVYPNIIIDNDEFGFSKQPGDESSNHSQGWACYGFFGSEPLSASTPDEYALSVPTPNPFNPAANMTFIISETGWVSLKVYDTLGREIALLAEGFYPAGSYEVVFDGSQLSSGVYFAFFEAGGQRNAQKLMLIK